MRWILITLFAFIVNPVYADYKPKAAKPTESWYTCRIDVTSTQGTGHGTGTPIACEKGKTYILTNAHVCNEPSSRIVAKFGDTFYPATYIYSSTLQYLSPTTFVVQGPDLSVIRIDAVMDYVPISAIHPALGDKVWQKGHSAGKDIPEYKEGHVFRGRLLVNSMETTIHSVPGDSGSGVFNDAGELVAVCWGGDTVAEAAVDMVLIHNFLLTTSSFEVCFPECRLRLEVRKAVCNPGPLPKNCPNGRCPLPKRPR